MQFPGYLIATGSSGSAVREVQTKLNSLGFSVGIVDGIYGEGTRSAVIKFQQKNGLSPDGIVGKLTWDKLFNVNAHKNYVYPGHLIGVGSAGEEVRQIQQRLSAIGYNPGTADGIFGNQTAQAVRNFQTDNFLDVDGVVGRITWQLLFDGVTPQGSGIDAPYPGIPLGIGSAGDDVKIIQNQLNRLGFNVGVADGIFGNQTAQGVRAFQASRHILVDGVVGRETWTRLMGATTHNNNNTPFPGVLLSEGSTGDLVRTVQKQLNGQQYYTGGIDGIFGPATKRAVMEFQRVHGLDVDGIIGPLTWDVLFRNSNHTVNVPFPGILFAIGSTGDHVKRIQQRLNGIGYNAGVADGIFGNNTQRAVINFQRENGLDPDGIVGTITWNALFNGRTSGGTGPVEEVYPGYLLSVGSSGDAVRYIQSKLNSLGYSSGTVDGIFGQMTRNAVIAFQHDYGLVPDGVVGPATWNKLSAAKSSGGNGGGGGGGRVDGILKIFIDAGHGGTDPGAIGHGLREKDIVLDVSLRQKQLLESAGYAVKLSRSTDTYLSLKQRTDMANEWGADLFISNHVNAGGGRGSEVWASIYGGAGRTFAEEIARNLAGVFGNNRGVKTRQGQNGDYFHVIRETEMPAVLIEHGFIDNAGDAAVLSNSDNRHRMALATVNAIKNVSPLSIDEKKEIRPHSGFGKAWKVGGKLTKLNPTITKTIRIPNFGTINYTARLITSDDSVNWNVSHSLTKQQLENILNNEITNKVKEKLEIEEKNLTAWVYDKTFLDGNIEKMGLELGKVGFTVAPPSLKFDQVRAELLYSAGFKDWKVHEVVTINLDVDGTFPEPTALATALVITIIGLIILYAALAVIAWGSSATAVTAAVGVLVLAVTALFGGIRKDS